MCGWEVCRYHMAHDVYMLMVDECLDVACIELLALLPSLLDWLAAGGNLQVEGSGGVDGECAE